MDGLPLDMQEGDVSCSHAESEACAFIESLHEVNDMRLTIISHI